MGTHLIRKLTQNNYTVTVVTRNIHQKGNIIKTQGNAGYIQIKECNIFDELKIRKLFENSDICINLKSPILVPKPQLPVQVDPHMDSTMPYATAIP